MKVTASRLQQQKQEELERNSSNDDLTDKEFDDKTSLNSDEIEMLIDAKSLQKEISKDLRVGDSQFKIQIDSGSNQKQPEQQKNEKEATDIDQLEGQGKKDTSDNDIFKLIAYNENIFRAEAEKKLNNQRNSMMKSAKNLKNFKDNASLQSVIEDPQIMRNVCKNFGITNCVETSIAIQNEILLVGTSAGLLFAYNIKSEWPIGIHKEDGKEFIDNAITSIDIHARRPEYCVIGFARGQMALININEIKKTVKLIKDHHKKPIVSVKFCDWIVEKPHQKMGIDHKCKDCANVQAWMFISCDTDGRVVQNTVTTIGFFLYANDFVLVDPMKQYEEPIFQALAPRMSSKTFPMAGESDNITLVALGSAENVVIYLTPEKQLFKRLTIEKPKRYGSQNMDDVIPIISELPILCWGFGKTPRYIDRTFALLAIAWGPLIQIVVFKDFQKDPEINEEFDIDGCYIIAPENAKNKRSPNGLDTMIQSMHFLDESLLVAVTSNQEIRVMKTEKFKENEFVPPQHMETVKFEEVDSRCKMMPIGSLLTGDQQEIEMERKCVLIHPLSHSKYGTEGSQTQSVFEDQIICLTTGGIYRMHHLNWHESLGNLESSVLQGSWIEVFAKALEIYLGKVKGLRMKGDDLRKDNMRDQLKNMIDNQVVKIINSWKTRAENNSKNDQKMQVQEDLNSKFQTLIRIVIEFCVEIQEPDFLFDTLLKKFHNEGKTVLFAEELKPYILSGNFSDCDIQESILREQILQHHQKVYEENQEQILTGVIGESINNSSVSPSENFEKILINFRFDSCSKDYKLDLIDYCRRKCLTSGLIYMCLNCYGEQGPLQAITQLKEFYLDTASNDLMGEQPMIQREDLQSLYSMPANFFDRIQLERSSCYLGLKLLWVARLFLSGKKFPKGAFQDQEWHVLCHDIIELITQDDLIQQMTEIDADAYFQIISIVFNDPSKQFSFLLEKPAGYQQEVMSHDKIIERISNYFRQLSTTDSAHPFFLCFIASIAGCQQRSQLSEKTQRLYLEVAIELLNQKEILINFNKDKISRRLLSKNQQQILSNASNGNANIPEDHKSFVLSEQMLVNLIEKCSSLLNNKKSLDYILKAAEMTDFHNIKLDLYEMNHDYYKCLQLFLKSNDINSQVKQIVKSRGYQSDFVQISEMHAKLEQLALKDDKSQEQLKKFENEVMSSALQLVQQDIMQTIKMCDAIFKSAHLKILEKMKDQQELQLKYINHLLELKGKDIKELITQSTAIIGQKKRSNTFELQQWNGILNMRVRLICILNPTNVKTEIKKIIKDNFYPMEDCLKTCNEFKQIEATALLNKKIGQYDVAIKLYLNILKQEMNFERLKKELYYLDKEKKRHQEKERQAIFAENQAKIKMKITSSNMALKEIIQSSVKTAVSVSQVTKDRNADLYRVWVEKFGQNIELLDRSLEKIQRICKSHPKETLQDNDESWKMMLTELFKILFHPSLRKKSYCKKHLKLKMVEFCRCILPYVPFSKIIYGASQDLKALKFKAVKELVHDVFSDKSQEIEMCENADVNQQRDLLSLQHQVSLLSTRGLPFVFESLWCGLCEGMINQKSLIANSNNEDSVLFDCVSIGSSHQNHSFHSKCLRKVILEEQEKDKNKKVQAKDVESELMRLFRCPTCYPKSQDCVWKEQPELKNARDKDISDKADDQSDSEEKSSAMKGDSIQAVIMPRKQMKAAERRQMAREKAMKNFEEQIMMSETLTRSDFMLY